MIGRTIRAELLKLRTTRTSTWLLLASVILSVGIAALLAAATPEADFQRREGVRSVLAQGGLAAGIMALILGIVATAGEYRHGTIALTLLVTPDRGRVALAQLIACGLAGLMLGAAAAAATLLVGLPLLDLRGIDLGLSSAQVAAIFLGAVAFAGLSGALGSALGSLVANQVVAVVLALLVLFLLEPLLSGLIDGYQRYSLVGVRTAVIGGSAQMAGDAEGGLPTFWLAAALWVGYTAALTAAAATVSRRRETG